MILLTLVSLAVANPQKRVWWLWWNCVRNFFNWEFWLDDVYRLYVRKCYTNINSTKSTWSNNSLMVLLYSNPKKWWIAFSIFALILGDKLSRNSSGCFRHHQIWNGVIWLELPKFQQHQTFVHSFTRPWVGYHEAILRHVLLSLGFDVLYRYVT